MKKIEINTLKFLLDYKDKELILMNQTHGQTYKLLGAGTSSETKEVIMYIQEVNEEDEDS